VKSEDPTTQIVTFLAQRQLRNMRLAARLSEMSIEACGKDAQQGVALTGRNTTGPPCAAPW